MRLKNSLFFGLVFFVGVLVLFGFSNTGQSFLIKVAKISFPDVARVGRKPLKAPSMPTLPPKGQEKVTKCYGFEKPCQSGEEPIIYFVTPTYSRREQIAELTRLAQTLLHVQNLHWIVAEDSQKCSTLVSSILKRYAIPYTHLASPLPAIYHGKPKRDVARGVSSRRAGLDWILDRHSKQHCNKQKAVVYFADDDNTYDLRLFEEIRYTNKVSVFPVGFIGYQSFSAPIVKNNQVIGFADPWFEHRKFPIDMAGFAVSVDFIIKQGANASMPYWVGHEEDQFLRSLRVQYQDLEPKANQCQNVFVWHTKTTSEKVPNLKFDVESENTNLKWLISGLNESGMISLDKRRGFNVLTCHKAEGCDTTKPIHYTG